MLPTQAVTVPRKSAFIAPVKAWICASVTCGCRSWKLSMPTIPRTRSGAARAASTATGPPMEWPTSTASSMPSASITATTSCPKAAMV